MSNSAEYLNTIERVVSKIIVVCWSGCDGQMSEADAEKYMELFIYSTVVGHTMMNYFLIWVEFCSCERETAQQFKATVSGDKIIAEVLHWYRCGYTEL